MKKYIIPAVIFAILVLGSLGYIAYTLYRDQPVIINGAEAAVFTGNYIIKINTPQK